MIFLAHAEPAVHLGFNEWLFVISACVVIFTLLGPQIIRDLRKSDD